MSAGALERPAFMLGSRAGQAWTLALAVILTVAACDGGTIPFLPQVGLDGPIPDGLSCGGLPVPVCEEIAANVGWRPGNDLLAGVVVVCTEVCDPNAGAATVRLRLRDDTEQQLHTTWERQADGFLATTMETVVGDPPADTP